jgi:hypothetical protein
MLTVCRERAGIRGEIKAGEKRDREVSAQLGGQIQNCLYNHHIQ